MFGRWKTRKTSALPDCWAWAGGNDVVVPVHAGSLPGFGAAGSDRRVVAELLAVHPSRVRPSVEPMLASLAAEHPSVATPGDLVPQRTDRCVILARRPGRIGWDGLLVFRRTLEEDSPERISYAVSTGAAFVSKRAYPSRLPDALAWAALRQIGMDAEAIASGHAGSRRPPEIVASIANGKPGIGVGNLFVALSEGLGTVFEVDLRYSGRVVVADRADAPD